MNEILDFLKDLKSNNNRDWFIENKERYELIKARFNLEVEKLILGLSTFDPEIRNLTATDCTWRIYRDTRFSIDKTPYKTHFSAFFAKGGKKSKFSGYYIHLEPGNCLIGGGVWCPDSKILTSIRKSIYTHTDEFISIISESNFLAQYKELDSEDCLKNLPRGFSKTFSHPELLKLKNYLINKELPDIFFNNNDWTNQALQLFALQVPFHHFLNNAIELSID
ncbi:MAG: DUF2461 domain-containing protein [Bacteroidales bacterium]